MTDMFSSLLTFFGLDAMPTNLGELLPWLFSVMMAVCLVLYILGMVSQMVRSVNKK